MLLISKKKVLAELEWRMEFYEKLYKDYQELMDDPETDEQRRKILQHHESLNYASYWSLKSLYLEIKNNM